MLRPRLFNARFVGSSITRESTIVNVNVSEKEGRSGKLAFVTVKHEVRAGGALAIHEEQDIVYRESATPGAATPPPTAARSDELWHRQIMPEEVLLFRYSAPAFIGHRIHYDKPYATEVEGYPNLVVHAPLIATLLMDLRLRHQPQATILCGNCLDNAPLESFWGSLKNELVYHQKFATRE